MALGAEFVRKDFKIKKGEKAYSTEIGDPPCQLGTNVIGDTLKIKDHSGEFSAVMLFPILLDLGMFLRVVLNGLGFPRDN